MKDIANETPLERGARINRENREALDRELLLQAQKQKPDARWLPYQDALIQTGGDLKRFNQPGGSGDMGMPRSYR
jgi:thioesterase domain-containing protein